MISASSKFAGLPDIDTAPDVYETADAEIDSDGERSRAHSPSTRRALAPNSREGSPTDEAIDRTANDASAARRTFGNAQWQSRGQSSSSRSLPRATVYSVPADRAEETALEKLRRLRLEVDELELQVADEASAATSTQERAKGEVTAAVLLQQVAFLRKDLDQPSLQHLNRQLKPDEADVNLADEETPTSSNPKTSGGLLAKLGLGPGDRSSGPLPPPRGEPKSSGALTEAGAGGGQLELRLAQIETFVGASEAQVDDAHAVPQPLVPTIARLERLLALLAQPRHLDSISRRVKVLVSDLERLHDARRKLGDSRPLAVALGPSAGGMTVAAPGGGQPVALKSTQGAAELPPDALQRLEALFALLPRVDPLLPLTPRLLTRLQSLSNLHSSAAEFATSLSAVQVELNRLTEREAGLKDVLAGVQKSIEANATTLGGNLASLEARVNDVSARMAALGV